MRRRRRRLNDPALPHTASDAIIRPMCMNAAFEPYRRHFFMSSYARSSAAIIVVFHVKHHGSPEVELAVFSPHAPRNASPTRSSRRFT